MKLLCNEGSLNDRLRSSVLSAAVDVVVVVEEFAAVVDGIVVVVVVVVAAFESSSHADVVVSVTCLDTGDSRPSDFILASNVKVRLDTRSPPPTPAKKKKKMNSNKKSIDEFKIYTLTALQSFGKGICLNRR